MAQLGLWFVRHLAATDLAGKRRPLLDALTRRVNLYRLTTLWDGSRDPAAGYRDERWDRVVHELAQAVAEASSTDTAVARGLELLTPLLRDVPLPPEPSEFGCWSGTVIGDGIADGHVSERALLPQWRRLKRVVRRRLGAPLPKHHLELHFRNARMPASPFADLRLLTRDLLALIDDVRSRQPRVHTVWCNTWLNDRPEFLQLFPAAWQRDALPRTPEDVDRTSRGRARLNTENWWGQFMSRDGGFHERRGRLFRESGGQFPHPNLLCHAAIEDVQAHLRAGIGVQP